MAIVEALQGYSATAQLLGLDTNASQATVLKTLMKVCKNKWKNMRHSDGKKRGGETGD